MKKKKKDYGKEDSQGYLGKQTRSGNANKSD